MKSKIYYLLIVLFTIQLFSCDDQIELTFISPGYEEIVELNDIHFEWICSEEGPFNLKIADDSTFQNIVLDSMIFDSQLSGINLFPGKDYFWKIEVEDKVFESTFSTKNLLHDIEKFNGDVSVRRYDSDMGSISNDTTFTEYFEFSLENSNLVIKSEFDSFDILCQFENFNPSNTVAYYLSSSSGTNFTLATYYYLSNKIVLEKRSGGIGGNRQWHATIQK